MTRHTKRRIPRLPEQVTPPAEVRDHTAFTTRLRDLEPAALEEFYETYFDRIYGYLRSLVGDEHTAEDLTQEVFYKIHRSLPRFEVGRDLDPWVFAIASNQMRDHWRLARTRLARREQDIDERGTADSMTDGGILPPESLAAEELEEGVREVVKLLPDGMRECVELRLFQELEFEEVAARIGRSEVAARKRYSRALALLRGLLGEAWSVPAA